MNDAAGGRCAALVLDGRAKRDGLAGAGLAGVHDTAVTIKSHGPLAGVVAFASLE